tara:strand:- start:35247 stop:37349 length:2103 start_codon:yes stop_codon:yes gene_type:complete
MTKSNVKNNRLVVSSPEDLYITNEYGTAFVDYEKVKAHSKLIEEYKDKYDIKTDCADECISCQIVQIDKYKNRVDADSSPWKVDCNLIPKSYDIDKDIRRQFSMEERKMHRILHDPVRWASHMLGWTARPYQKLAMRCTAKQMVHRWGRRSGKTEGTAVEILWYTLTNKIVMGHDNKGNPIEKGPATLIVTPFLSQIKLIFEKMEELMARNSDIQKSCVRFVKTPYYRMEFSNGAKISGFTTGSKSKGEGSVLRGQGANKIYLDEADYMEEGDYQAIMPILYEAEDRSIVASSTPTGKRERYYKWCVDSPAWKEFHYPSTARPDWDRIEEKVLDETSEAEFMQEYMCEFTAQDVGVYQPNYVNTAISRPPYKYGDHKYNVANIYSMGIDWNSNAGTEIVVIAMDRSHQMWVVDARNVKKQGWTQLAAIEAVIDMNKMWMPKFIYADSGYGATSIELLQKYSLQQRVKDPADPAGRIYEALRKFEFGGKLEIRDPVTGQILKKPAKDFMVQNAVRRFEEGIVHIPSDEKVLYKQLLNYIVKGVNQAGLRIYGQNNKSIGDHRLDAFNLALVAYKLELSEFAKTSNIVTSVLRTGLPGQGHQEKKVKENNPFVADIRYPEGYLDYNINVNKNDVKDRSSMFKSLKAKNVVPGAVHKDFKPDFLSDGEHKRKGGKRSSSGRVSRNRWSSGRGSIGKPKKRGGF